ncbi:MAG TPA: hypothetical protein VMM16_14200 [Verrucomicrobiae bacterium]|nr:hypothetical protein [Verrucomicrobiae bacterium]
MTPVFGGLPIYLGGQANLAAHQGAVAAKARAAYQDFLALRKSADPDPSILKEAKFEYAKLH